MTIAHDVSGGAGDYAGSIGSLAKIGAVTIGGSMLGGGVEAAATADVTLRET